MNVPEIFFLITRVIVTTKIKTTLEECFSFQISNTHTKKKRRLECRWKSVEEEHKAVILWKVHSPFAPFYSPVFNLKVHFKIK